MLSVLAAQPKRRGMQGGSGVNSLYQANGYQGGSGMSALTPTQGTQQVMPAPIMQRGFGNDALPGRGGGGHQGRGRGPYVGGGGQGPGGGGAGSGDFSVNIPANPLTPDFLNKLLGTMRTGMSGDPMGLFSGPVYQGGGAAAGMTGVGGGAPTGAARQISPAMHALGNLSPSTMGALQTQQSQLANRYFYPAANAMLRTGEREGAEYELGSQMAQAGIGRQNESLNNAFLALQLQRQNLASPFLSQIINLLGRGLGDQF